MSVSRILLLAVLLGLFAGFFYFDLGYYLDFAYLKSRHVAFSAYYAEYPLMTIVIFSAIYIISTALSFPGATILSLVGGALFGLFWGTVIVSFASSIGATLAFLVSRFLLKDFVQEKFSGPLTVINEGIRKEGIFYLLTLRLVPVFPFFVINLLMGLTHMSTLRYFWVSQLGMLLGTVVYVNAGVQLAQLDTPADMLSLELLFAMALLGLSPLLAKKLLPGLQGLAGKYVEKDDVS